MLARYRKEIQASLGNAADAAAREDHGEQVVISLLEKNARPRSVRRTRPVGVQPVLLGNNLVI